MRYIELLYDPLLMSPLYSTVLMGALLGLVGVFVVFKKQSLVGEVLAHASYPGMIFGLVFSYLMYSERESYTFLFAFLGAGVTALLAHRFISYLVTRRFMKEDSALSFIIGSSFAFSLFMISLLQRDYPLLSKQLEALLIGQVATLKDFFLVITLVVFFVGALLFFLFKREIQTYLFDEEFSTVHQLIRPSFSWIFHILIVLTVILGIRTMGVVLLSSMLVFPAVAARALARNFHQALWISVSLGGFSGFLGVLLSNTCSLHIQDDFHRSLWLPTGPLISLLLFAIFLLVVLFSPYDGLLQKFIRRRNFYARCERENLLKSFWKACTALKRDTITYEELSEYVHFSRKTLKKRLISLKKEGYIRVFEKKILVTEKGLKQGRNILRLHRMWELYLVEYCGMPKERVHPSAEEMEHILTPEIEKELSYLLQDPLYDPHKQPIPSLEGSLVLMKEEK
jgi:manganese/zinc/iron transport system permease protein